MQRLNTTPEGKRILARICRIGPFTEGSLTTTRKRCGNPKCRCASEGPIHQTTLLTWKEENTTHTLYIPMALKEEVARWVKQAKLLKRLSHQMSRAQRRYLVAKKKSSKP